MTEFLFCQPSLPVVLLCPWRTADTSKHASHHKCRSIVRICKLKGTYLPVQSCSIPSTCPLRADLTQSDSLDFSLLHCGWTVTMIKWSTHGPPFQCNWNFQFRIICVDLRSGGWPYLQGIWHSTLKTVEHIICLSYKLYTAGFIIHWSWSMESDAPGEM